MSRCCNCAGSAARVPKNYAITAAKRFYNFPRPVEGGIVVPMGEDDGFWPRRRRRRFVTEVAQPAVLRRELRRGMHSGW